MNYISIKNLNFGFEKKKLFNNINIDIKKGSFVAIMAPNSSGKSTLLKILSANIITDANITYNKKTLSFQNIEDYRKKVTLFTPYEKFYCKTVLDELLLISNNISISTIKNILKEFNMIKYINKSPSKLNYINSQKLVLIKAILNHSELLLLDDIFSYFDKYSKIEFIGLVKKYQIDMNMTVVYATCDLDDIIFCDKMIVISEGDVLYNGCLDKIYLNEKILKSSKVNIPLLNQLIDRLKLYDIINDRTCTIEEVVNEICK